MAAENDDETKTVNLEGDFKSKNMITLETTIEDAKHKKKTLSSTMDSVISLIREVEHREKLADEAAKKVSRNRLDILAKVEQLKQAQISANETNQTLAKEVYAQRDVLATEMDALQISVAGLLTIGDSSIDVLDQISRALETRLISALKRKEEAEEDILKMEVSAQKTFAYHEGQMVEVVQESERLKREVVKNSKMREFVTRHGHEVNMLRQELNCKRQDVNKLKAKLDNAIVLSDILSSNETLCEPQSESNDSNKCLNERHESPDYLWDDLATDDSYA